MATQPALPQPESIKLLNALALFARTFGKPTSDLALQATIGALAAVAFPNASDLNDIVRQTTIAHQQAQRRNPTETAAEAAAQIELQTIIREAKERLDKPKKALIIIIRTYLQRVSSKLSAAEFIEMTKVAIALLDQAQSGARFSLAEGERLLYSVLQTFGTQLSQPIPALGERRPQRLMQLVTQLAKYQKIIRSSGLETALLDLVNQTLKQTAQQLSPELIRTVLKNGTVIIAPEFDSQAGLDELAHALFFKIQLQLSSPRPAKTDQAIAEQLDQAVADFNAKYRPLGITQPTWDDELSVSSTLFAPGNFETAHNDFTWAPPSFSNKNSRDETNS